MTSDEGLPPRDGGPWETRTADPKRRCPHCGRTYRRRVVVRAYRADLDHDADGKHPGWAKTGWLETFWCHTSGPQHRVITEAEVRAAGARFGGWKRCKAG